MNFSALSNLYGIGNIIAKITGGTTLGSIIAPGYRPSQWKHYGGGPEAILTKATNIGGLIFDGVLNSSHESSLNVTKHPVQYGADIADHAIVNPARLSLTIMVSDAMGYITGPEQYPGNGQTKSARAYDTLVQFQKSRIPMKVWTRLQTYDNMLITSITANEDYTTATALKANIELEQMIIVNVSETKVSARNWTTGGGGKNSVPPATYERQSTLSSIIGDPEGNLRARM